MIGSPASTAPASAASVPAAGTMPAGPARGSGGSGTDTGSVWWWVALVALYVLWAVLHNHEKVQEAVKPQNVKLNVHNLLLIFLAVVITVPLAKIALTKISVWFPWSKPVLVPLLTLVSSS